MDDLENFEDVYWLTKEELIATAPMLCLGPDLPGIIPCVLDTDTGAWCVLGTDVDA